MRKQMIALFGMSIVVLGLAGCSEFPRLSVVQSPPKQVRTLPADSTGAPLTDTPLVTRNSTHTNSNSSHATQRMSLNTAHQAMTVSRKITFSAIQAHHNLNALAHLTGVPILTYHDISGIPKDPWSLTPVQFEEQMACLYNNGYHVIPLSTLYEKLISPNHIQLPVKPIVITFDDGYESNYSAAYPILKKYHFPATIFMVSSFAGRPGFMTWTQLQDMQTSRMIDVESHTVTHVHLANLSVSQVETQLVDSRQTIQEKLKKPVNFFCYPFDSYNASVVREVRAAGYEMAVTDNFGLAGVSQSRYTVDRIEVLSNFTLAEFQAAITGQRPSVASKELRRA